MIQIFNGLCSRWRVSRTGLRGSVTSLTFKYLMDLLNETRNLVSPRFWKIASTVYFYPDEMHQESSLHNHYNYYYNYYIQTHGWFSFSKLKRYTWNAAIPNAVIQTLFMIVKIWFETDNSVMARMWVTLLTLLHLKMAGTGKPSQIPGAALRRAAEPSVLAFHHIHYILHRNTSECSLYLSQLKKNRRNPNIRTPLTEVIKASL